MPLQTIWPAACRHMRIRSFCGSNPALETTDTFKLKKQQLMHEGFDPELVSERLYFRDPALGAYRLLEAESFSEIVLGIIRL